MDKKTFNSLLSSYIDGELSAAERDRFEAVLRKNPELAQLCDEIRKICQMVRDLPHKQAPLQVRETLQRRLERLARKTKHSFDPPAFLNELLRKPEHLLNAYVDGELSPKQREYVETHLLQSEGHQQTVQHLHQASKVLSGMKSVSAPKGLVQNVMAQVRQEGSPAAETALTGDGQKRPFAELLSAYADGEISPQRKKLVERKLKKSPKTRQHLRQYEACSRELSSLPKMSAPVGAVDRAVDWLKKHEPGTRPEVITQQASRSIAARHHNETAATSERKNLFRTAGLLAASLLIGWAVVSFQLPDEQGESIPQVAQTDPRLIVPPLRTPDSTPSVDVAAGDPPPNVEESFPTEVASNEPSNPRTTPEFYVLPLEKLKDIKAGEVVEVLNEKQVKLVCVDVERVYNRLRLVMMNNNVSVVNQEGKIKPDHPLYVLDIQTSPDQMSEILADLWESEKNEVASVDITPPSEKLLDEVQNGATAVVKTESAKSAEKESGPIMVPRIELPDNTLANRPNPRLKEALESAALKGSKPKSTVNRNAEKNRSAKRPASQQEQVPQQTASTEEKQVRVLFVLEPGTSRK